MELNDEIPQGNANRPSIEIALDLIYRSTRQRFPADKVKFGIPKAIDLRPDIKQDENTFVQLSVEKEFDSRFKGGLFYRRIPLSILIPDNDLVLTLPEYPFSASDILSEINVKFQSQLTLDDIINTNFTDPTAPLEITAAPESLAWIGKLDIAQHIAPYGSLVTEDGSYLEIEDGSTVISETA